MSLNEWHICWLEYANDGLWIVWTGFRLYEQVYMDDSELQLLWAACIVGWMAWKFVSCMLVPGFIGLYAPNCSCWEVTTTMLNVILFGYVILHLG